MLHCGENRRRPSQREGLASYFPGGIISIPIRSMYDVFTHLWLILMVKFDTCRQICQQHGFHGLNMLIFRFQMLIVSDVAWMGQVW